MLQKFRFSFALSILSLCFITIYWALSVFHSFWAIIWVSPSLVALGLGYCCLHSSHLLSSPLLHSKKIKSFWNLFSRSVLELFLVTLLKLVFRNFPKEGWFWGYRTMPKQCIILILTKPETLLFVQLMEILRMLCVALLAFDWKRKDERGEKRKDERAENSVACVNQNVPIGNRHYKEPSWEANKYNCAFWMDTKGVSYRSVYILITYIVLPYPHATGKKNAHLSTILRLLTHLCVHCLCLYSLLYYIFTTLLIFSSLKTTLLQHILWYLTNKKYRFFFSNDYITTTEFRLTTLH